MRRVTKGWEEQERERCRRKSGKCKGPGVGTDPTGREDELGADVNCSRTGVPSFGRGFVRLCRDCSGGVWASFQTWAFILEVMG